MVTAIIRKTENEDRINQCDLFSRLKIVESVERDAMQLSVNYIEFPLMIVLNQDCDLNSDNRNKTSQNNKNTSLIHLIVAPVFIFEKFLIGNHWNGVFEDCQKQKRTDTAIKMIMKNEDPRYHYLSFPERSGLPDMIIDFKHFFTVSEAYLYARVDRRIGAVNPIYREKILQRFAFYQSRIGLPD